ncbi:MAG TPA: MazG family protein [Candidatus Paceibacterota bacterium]|nr:MazG family protein [Verrucomicrobiota bacterium]HRY49952.1 MazG family protein [Candidatus Paceibacterota bacterium]
MKASSSSAVPELLRIMARLRSPTGCPWDRQQNHRSLRFHAVEEVYELIDAIEANDDQELAEELGDLLLQVVFHCQLAQERHAFDFDAVVRRLCAKLIGRHPHVFGQARVRGVDAVWAQWDRIKTSEKAGTRHARHSALDGIPRHLPALLRAEKLVKKAKKSGLLPLASPRSRANHPPRSPSQKRRIARRLFLLAATAHHQGWSAEALLREEIHRTEQMLRRKEKLRIRKDR